MSHVVEGPEEVPVPEGVVPVEDVLEGPEVRIVAGLDEEDGHADPSGERERVVFQRRVDAADGGDAEGRDVGVRREPEGDAPAPTEAEEEERVAFGLVSEQRNQRDEIPLRRFVRSVSVDERADLLGRERPERARACAAVKVLEE